MAIEAGEINEAELMRTCGHLYTAIAIESLSTTLLGMIFTYLLLLITSKGRLKRPGKAALLMAIRNVNAFAKGVHEELKDWSRMNKLPLERRFALCRKTNQAICVFQILICMLTVERWLHINNVNGFRYLGYSMTCPPMQTELLILIAPVVPCFKMNCVITYGMTMLMLWLGYAASMIDGDMWEGSFSVFTETMDINDLRPQSKLWFTSVACLIQFYLSFVQIPVLYLLYRCGGGVKGGLPHGYTRLLLIVAVSWLAFPIWWLLSYEGMSIITDTKMNAAGFAVLNVTSKGAFTLQMLAMTKWHRNEKKRQQAIRDGRRPSEESEAGFFEEDDQEQLDEAGRRPTWVVGVLLPYDRRNTSQRWQHLDVDFQKFLKAQEVTSSRWDKMRGDQQQKVQEAYKNTLALVEEGAGSSDPMSATLRQASVNSRASKRAPIVRPEIEEGPEIEEVGPQSSGSTASFVEKDVPDVTVDHVFKKSQLVSCVQGHRGRVQEATCQSVTLVLPGGFVETIDIVDVTVVQVRFRGVTGIEGVDTDCFLHWACLVDGCPETETQTHAKKRSEAELDWEQEVELYGLGPGDLVTIRLFASSPGSSPGRLLGEARLACCSFLDGSFEGDLQLCQEGQITSIRVNLCILALNLPGLPRRHMRL